MHPKQQPCFWSSDLLLLAGSGAGSPFSEQNKMIQWTDTLWNVNVGLVASQVTIEIWDRAVASLCCKNFFNRKKNIQGTPKVTSGAAQKLSTLWTIQNRSPHAVGRSGWLCAHAADSRVRSLHLSRKAQWASEPSCSSERKSLSLQRMYSTTLMQHSLGSRSKCQTSYYQQPVSHKNIGKKKSSCSQDL